MVYGVIHVNDFMAEIMRIVQFCREQMQCVLPTLVRFLPDHKHCVQ